MRSDICCVDTFHFKKFFYKDGLSEFKFSSVFCTAFFSYSENLCRFSQINCLQKKFVKLFKLKLSSHRLAALINFNLPKILFL